MARPVAGRSWRSGRSICSRKSGSGKGLLACAGGAAARGDAGGGATIGEGVRAAE
jgi:hypothetical protein